MELKLKLFIVFLYILMILLGLGFIYQGYSNYPIMKAHLEWIKDNNVTSTDIIVQCHNGDKEIYKNQSHLENSWIVCSTPNSFIIQKKSEKEYYDKFNINLDYLE